MESVSFGNLGVNDLFQIFKIARTGAKKFLFESYLKNYIWKVPARSSGKRGSFCPIFKKTIIGLGFLTVLAIDFGLRLHAGGFTVLVNLLLKVFCERIPNSHIYLLF